MALVLLRRAGDQQARRVAGCLFRLYRGIELDQEGCEKNCKLLHQCTYAEFLHHVRQCPAEGHTTQRHVSENSVA